MAPSVADRLAGVHPRMLGIGAKDDPRFSGIDIGSGIDFALNYARIEVKEAFSAMGYSDDSTLRRWIQNRETANVAKLWLLGEKFQEGFLLWLASHARSVRTQTTLTVEQAS